MGPNNNEVLSENFFHAGQQAQHILRIKNLKIKNILLINDNVKDKNTFERDTRITLSDLQYIVLTRICRHACNTYGANRNSEKCSAIREFFNRTTKGSKKTRQILCLHEQLAIPRNINTYANNTNTIIGLENAKKLNSMWGQTSLSNDTRTFLFKMINNSLGYNSVVANFVAGHSPDCTFCTIAREPVAEVENILHLFFTCNHVEPLLIEFYTWLKNTNAPYHISRNDYFSIAASSDNSNNDKIFFIITKLLQKYVWDCKTHFHLPSIDEAKTRVKINFKIAVSSSRKLKNVYEASDFVQILG
jgi:hypothetical protein